MLRTSTGELSQDAYANIARIAASDVQHAIAFAVERQGRDTSERFRDCRALGFSSESPLSLQVATMTYIESVCRRLGYEIIAFPVGSDHPWAHEMHGFVSWLFAYQQEKTLLIVCGLWHFLDQINGSG